MPGFTAIRASHDHRLPIELWGVLCPSCFEKGEGELQEAMKRRADELRQEANKLDQLSASKFTLPSKDIWEAARSGWEPTEDLLWVYHVLNELYESLEAFSARFPDAANAIFRARGEVSTAIMELGRTDELRT
jgi:hypothetical protein